MKKRRTLVAMALTAGIAFGTQTRAQSPIVHTASGDLAGNGTDITYSGRSLRRPAGGTSALASAPTCRVSDWRARCNEVRRGLHAEIARQ
jgi:hypothetical protein